MPAVEDGDPLARAVLADAHLEALVRRPDDDQADPRPRVEPPVEQAQLGRARRDLEEPKRGAEEREAAVLRGAHSMIRSARASSDGATAGS